MNRTYLTRAIRELAGVYGYTIHTETDVYCWVYTCKS